MFLLRRRYCNCLGKVDKNNCENVRHHLQHQRMQKLIAPTNTTSAINWVPKEKLGCCTFLSDYFQTCNFPWITNVSGIPGLKNYLLKSKVSWDGYHLSPPNQDLCRMTRSRPGRTALHRGGDRFVTLATRRFWKATAASGGQMTWRKPKTNKNLQTNIEVHINVENPRKKENHIL